MTAWLFLQICRNYCYDCNMSSIEQLIATLRTHGQSSTQQRRAVFSALQGQEPLSMHVVDRSTGVDRASVYRTISLFEQLGIVQRLQTGWKYKLELSDTFHEHHHHATCLGCGRTISLREDAALEALFQQIATAYNFVLTNHQLELQGCCAQCSATGTTA
jgi:Fur family ferric uptake transcriptional regulator